MNQAFKNFSRSCSIFYLLASMLLASCESYRFANPLPVDSKNRYKTPKKLRGIVYDIEKDKNALVFEKYIIKSTGNDTLKIIDGIWFSARDTSRIDKSDTTAWKELNALRSFESKYSIKFDPVSKSPVDTMENYVIKGAKIYAVKNNELSEGHPYVLRGDTIYLMPEWHLAKFGPDTFFRKVDSYSYLLNIRDGILGDDDGSWWQIYLVTKRKNERIIFYEWSGEIKDDPSLIYSGSHNYFNSQWTRKDILKLISEGAFVALNEKEKIE